MFAELKFPGIEEMVQWPAAFGEGTPFAFNKVALISLIAMAVPVIWFLVAGVEALLRSQHVGFPLGHSHRDLSP